MEWDPSAVAAIVMVLLTLGLFAVWRCTARNPGALQWLLTQRAWSRLIRWTAVYGVAAFVASELAGGGEVSAAIVAVLVVTLLVEAMFWTYAKTLSR